MKLRAMGKKVWIQSVKLKSPDYSESGVILPDNIEASKHPGWMLGGRVLSVGAECDDPELKKGDIVIISTQYFCLSSGNTEYDFLCYEIDICAVVEDLDGWIVEEPGEKKKRKRKLN